MFSKPSFKTSSPCSYNWKTPFVYPETHAKIVAREGSTGDTFMLLCDAIRLQRDMEGIITSFKLSKGLCRELSAQLEVCEGFLSDLVKRYEGERLALESKTYFAAFMAYTEVLNKASEFILLLKDKGPLTRLKNRDKYRKATRHLKALLSTRVVKPTSSDASLSTMITIKGTLRLLRAQVFDDADSYVESVCSDSDPATPGIPPRLGSGCIIYKASYEGLLVAEKVYSDIDSRFLKDVQHEANIWMQLRDNPRVAYIHGIWIEGSSVGVISDYYEGDNLHQLISRFGATKAALQREVQVRLSLELVELVVSLHSRGSAFGGLHPRALFVNPAGGLELGSVESLAHRLFGDFPDEYIGYAAPEILLNRFAPSAPTLASDIFSLGIVLGSLWCTAHPYSYRIKRDFILKGGKPEWFNRLPPDLAPIVTPCLEFKPSARPLAAELLNLLQRVFSEEPIIVESPPGLASDPSVTSAQVRPQAVKAFNRHATFNGSSPVKPIKGGTPLESALALHAAGDYEGAYAGFVHLSGVGSDLDADYHLGLYYYYGREPFAPRDIRAAVGYLRRAAENGYGDAHDLGVYYLDPALGGRNFELAFEHFQRAAAALSPGGCYHLAQCHRNGLGTFVDPNLASYALWLSASLGYGPAVSEVNQNL
ncbi:hypothetical protein L0F63_006189 [Massospora cicadina]|nr:hypothetical protein L0F63_006189 [Massospora cicadina]